MSTTTFVMIVVLVIIGLIFIFFPESRKLFSGFIHLFFKDMASTPEGAEAIFEEKIDEARDSYGKVDDVLNRMSGKLSVTKKEYEKLMNQIKECEQKCETMVKNGDMNGAQLFAEQREELVAEVNNKKNLIQEYTNAVQEAQEAHKLCEKRLQALQREKRERVGSIKTKTELKGVYDDLNELKAVTNTDKLLSSIREKDKALTEQVEGAKVVHNSRTSTKIQKANEQAQKLQTNNYLESLKKKYNK